MSETFNLIFGLTADPIHLGHEQVIINSIEHLTALSKTAKVTLVPVYNPNLIAGKNSPKASFVQRLDMCEIVAKRLSKQTNTDIFVTDLEKRISEQTQKANYSFDTLNALNLDNSLFMVSADHFKGRWPKLRKWYRWQDLVSQFGLLINQRPGNKINLNFIKKLQTINPNVFVVQSERIIDTSSTFIRKHFSIQKDMSEHLSQDVYEFIKEQRLYLK